MHFSVRKQAIIATIISWSSLIIGAILSIYYTPLALQHLGDAEFGIKNFSMSFTSYLSYLTLGMSSAYLRFFFKYAKEEGENGKNKINGSFLLAYSIASIGVIVLSLVISLCFKNNFIDLSKYSESEKELVNINFLIYSASLLITFLFSIYNLFLTANKKFIIISSISFVNTNIGHLLNIIILIFGGKSIALSIGALLLNLTLKVCELLYCHIKLKIRIDFKINKEKFIIIKNILLFSIFTFLASLMAGLNKQVDTTILGLKVGPESVTTYSIAATFPTYLHSMVLSVLIVFDPILMELSINDKKEELLKILKSSSRIVTSIILFIIGGFISCGKAFISLWVGDKYLETYMMTIILMFSCLIEAWLTINLMLHTTKSKHQFAGISYSIVFVINIIISYLLVSKYQIYGCIIGTIISILLEYMLLKVYTVKKMNFKYLLLKDTFIISLSTILPALLIVSIMQLDTSVDNRTLFFKSGTMYVALSVMLLFALNKGLSGEMKKYLFKKRNN